MVPDIWLRGCPSCPISGIGTFFLLLCLFGFEVLRGFRACLVGVLHYFLNFLFPCSAMDISMGPSRYFVLCIGSNSTEVSGSMWTGGESDSLAMVVHRVALGGPSFPLDKGKGKISEIRYPSSSEYLRVAIQNAEAVGPSRVEPSYGEVFAAWYGPPFGVQVWCPDVLTFYVVQVPKMVCFFEVEFENGLRFPLHPFIKRVLQHFNVCPSQLSPNFWGILVGLLVIFKDRGLGVPSIALLLDFFNVKEATEGFLYISKRSNAKLIISDFQSSHKYWKEHYFFVNGRHWEYNPFDREDTLGVPAVWTTPVTLRELPFTLVWPGFQRLYDISNIALVAWPSGARPDLSPKDGEVKRKLVKCALRSYSELIRSDIPGPFGARPARLPLLRPSPISVMKPSLPPVSKSSSSSVLEPFNAKPTWGELRARLEVLAKKKRSVKRKS